MYETLKQINILVLKDMLRFFEKPVYGRKEHLRARLFMTLKETLATKLKEPQGDAGWTLKRVMTSTPQVANVLAVCAVVELKNAWPAVPGNDVLMNVERQAREGRHRSTGARGVRVSPRKANASKNRTTNSDTSVDNLIEPIDNADGGSVLAAPGSTSAQGIVSTHITPTQPSRKRSADLFLSSQNKRYRGLVFSDDEDREDVRPAQSTTNRNERNGNIAGEDVEARFCGLDVEESLAPVRLDDVEGCPAKKLGRVSEFVRLLLIIRDNSEIRHQFNESRHSLHRTKLDAKKSLDDFWSGPVHRLFRSVEYQPTAHVSSIIDGIDTRRPPQSERGPDTLREYFYGMRKFFAKAFDRVDRSGLNDGSLSTMREAIRKTEGGVTRNGELSVLGWKALLIYEMLGLGNGATKNRDFDLIAFFCKMATQVDKFGHIRRLSVEGGLPEFDNCASDPSIISVPPEYAGNVCTPTSAHVQERSRNAGSSSGDVIPNTSNPILVATHGGRRGSTESIHRAMEQRLDRHEKEERAREERNLHQASIHRMEDRADRLRLLEILDRSSTFQSHNHVSDTSSTNSFLMRIDMRMKSDAGKERIRETIKQLSADIKNAAVCGYSESYKSLLEEDLRDAEREYAELRNEYKQEMGRISREGERVGNANYSHGTRGGEVGRPGIVGAQRSEEGMEIIEARNTSRETHDCVDKDVDDHNKRGTGESL